MKTKITAIVLFVILALIMTVSASAEAASLSADKVSVQPGENVTVTVDLSGCSAVRAGGVTFGYDASMLEIVDCSWGISTLLMKDFNMSASQGVFAFASPAEPNGTLLSVIFRAKDGAPSGSVDISCSVSLMDPSNTPISVPDAQVAVTVADCDHSGAQPKDEIPSSCTVPGFAAGVYCDHCAIYVSGGEQLPLADHSYDNWVNLNADGHWHKCTICQAEETVPHDYVWTNLGTMHHGLCSVCGDGATGNHDFSSQQATDEYKASDAECTHPATYYYSCLVCGLADTNTFESGDPLPHTYAEVADDRFKVSDATCEHGAIYNKSCTCGAVDTETFEVGSPLPHSYTLVADDRFKVSDADCEHAAIYYMSCSICGLQGTEKGEHGTALGHDFSTAYSYTATHHYHVCTRDGCTATDIPEEHSGGSASCTVQAICTTCTQPYGSLIEHSYNQEVAEAEYLKSEANCTQAAVYYKSCVCGEKGIETFKHGAELGHDFSTTYSSNVNYHYYECLRDGCYVTDGRDFHEGGTASCSQQAVCDVCHHAYGSLLDHNYGDWRSTGEDGQERQCQDCGAWDSSGHVWDDGIVITPATEETPGQKLLSCVDCDQSKMVEIPMLSHTHAFGEAWKNNADQHWHECACGEKQQLAAHTWNETVTKPATCEETGVKMLSCTVCGATKTEDIPLADHSWDAGTVTTEATEQTTGSMTHICTVCRESKTEVIPVLEHTHTAAGAGEWSVNDMHHWLACSCGDRIGEAEHTWADSIAVATCESKGLITYTCVICGYTRTEEIAQLEHTWNDGVVTTEPTEDATGVKTYTCTSCGKATRTEDIPQLEKAEEPEQPERPGVGGPFLFLIILLIGLLIILLVFFLYARKKDRYN